MRRLFTLLILIALFITPAAAQSDRAPEGLTALGDLLPAETTFFLAGRADEGYLETLEGVWPQLEEASNSTSFPSYEDIFETGTLGEILGDTTPWRGDNLAVATLSLNSFGAFLDDFGSSVSSGDFVLLISVSDRAAAETWLLNEADFTANPEVQNGFTTYSIPSQGDEFAVLLSDTHMVITTANEFLADLLSGDFARLSNATPFTDVTNALALAPNEYDILGYLNIGGALREINTREFITREMTPYRQFRFALADFAGSMAFGGVFSDGKDFILDGAWHYGDSTALVDMGIDPAQWVAKAIDPTLFITASQDTQFFLQATDLQGTYELTLDTLSVLSELASSSPELALSFGLSSLQGLDLGSLLRGANTVGFAGLTGLNLENDVLAVLDNTDFALIFSVIENDDAPLGLNADAALITRHTGGAEAWLPALAEAAALYGYPTITPQPIGSGQALNFGPMVAPMLMPVLGQAAAEDPALNPMLGVNEAIAALGTRNAVEYALNAPTDLSNVRIAFPPLFSLFIQEPQIIGYINGKALKSAPDWTPTIDSATFSAAASDTGMVGRLTFTLVQPER